MLGIDKGNAGREREIRKKRTIRGEGEKQQINLCQIFYSLWALRRKRGDGVERRSKTVL